jgi:hypothetical protein
MRRMHIYLFASRPEPSVRAYTSDLTGANLPADYAPWDKLDRPSRTVSIPNYDDGGPISTAIDRQGFFLVTRRRSNGRRPTATKGTSKPPLVTIV